MTPIRTPLCDSVEVGPKGSAIDPLPSWRQRDAMGVQIGSVWTLTQEERDAIARGANIVLLVWAERTPPVWLGIGEGEGFQPIAEARSGEGIAAMAGSELEAKA